MAENPSEQVDFFELLAKEATSDRGHLVAKIIANAKEGEPSALKLLERALLEYGSREDGKLPVTNEQFQNIISLAAERIALAKAA